MRMKSKFWVNAVISMQAMQFPCYIKVVEISNKKIVLPIPITKRRFPSATNTSRELNTNVEIINKKSSENCFLINLAHAVNIDKVNSSHIIKTNHKKEIIKLEKGYTPENAREVVNNVPPYKTDESEKIRFCDSFMKCDNDYGREIRPCYPRRNFIGRRHEDCMKYRYRKDRRRFSYVQRERSRKEKI